MDSSSSDSNSSINLVPPPSLDPSPSSSSQGLGLGVLGRRQVPSSPYLNFDPRVVSPVNDSPWIFPDGATSRPARGIFEMAFTQIGCSYMVGHALGGSLGSYNGLKAISEIATPTAWAIKRSTVINHVTRNAVSTGNTFGTIAFTFSAIGVILNWGLQVNEQNSTMLSATTTGLLYGAVSEPKASSTGSYSFFKKAGTTMNQLRLKRSLAGGTVGLALSLIYILAMKENK